MKPERIIRRERSFEFFSEGLALVKDIHKMWIDNEDLSRRGEGRLINANIEALMGRYDLTFDEWYYWSDMAREALKPSCAW